LQPHSSTASGAHERFLNVMLERSRIILPIFPDAVS
jgi:hypothetical protein